MGLPLPVDEADPLVRRLVSRVDQGATDEQIVDALLVEVTEEQRADVVLAVTVAALRGLADPIRFLCAPLLDEE